MNFLSHYYLQRKNNDYYDVGLTLPDVLGLHSKNVRVTERFLLSFSNLSRETQDLIDGMFQHIKLDSFFHRSEFFRENIYLIENLYKEGLGDSIAFYYSHILLEIMIDKFILEIEPEIAKDFYDLHKRFDFTKIVFLFENLKNFHKDKFLDFTRLLANSSFLNDYKDNSSVITSLRRVTTRIGLPIEIKVSDKIFEEYVSKLYEKLFDNIKKFILVLKDRDIN